MVHPVDAGGLQEAALLGEGDGGAVGGEGLRALAAGREGGREQPGHDAAAVDVGVGRQEVAREDGVVPARLVVGRGQRQAGGQPVEPGPRGLVGAREDGVDLGAGQGEGDGAVAVAAVQRGQQRHGVFERRGGGQRAADVGLDPHQPVVGLGGPPQVLGLLQGGDPRGEPADVPHGAVGRDGAHLPQEAPHHGRDAHAVARADEPAARHQVGGGVEGVAAGDRLEVGQAERRGEQGGVAEQGARVGVEQVPGPTERGADGAVAGGAAQAVEAGEHVGRGHRREPARGELDGERDAVERVGHGLRVGLGQGRRAARPQQRHRVDERERAELHGVLGHGLRPLRGEEQPRAVDGDEEVERAVLQALHLVEHQQQLLLAVEGGDEAVGGDLQRARHPRGGLGAGPGAAEHHHHDLVALVAPGHRRAQRQAALPHAAEPEDRHHAVLVERGLDAGEVVAAAHERGRLQRQRRRLHRRQLEAVAAAAAGREPAGAARVDLELLAQPRDGVVDGARDRARAVAPHVDQQLLARGGGAAAVVEVAQQRGLELGERGGAPRRGDAPLLQVDLRVADPDGVHRHPVCSCSRVLRND
ncbi:MAG: hypothetical protein R3F59_15160 [Myxococcota bacterium]